MRVDEAKVEEACSAIRAATTAAQLDAIEFAPLGVLERPAVAKQLLAALLELACSEPAANETAGAAMQLAFQLAISQDGSSVACHDGQPPHEPSADQPLIGILILGFGGASHNALAPLVEWYRKWMPGSRIVVTTRPAVRGNGTAAALELQQREVLAGLKDCSRILVHSISNNGHALWVELLQSAEGQHAFRDRLAGVIYDCGACATTHMADESLVAVIMQSIYAAALHHRLTSVLRDTNAFRRLKETATAIVTGRLLTFSKSSLGSPEVMASQLKIEPRVPTLVLSSEADVVLPLAGVRLFAESMSKGNRYVKVVVLKGEHAQLLSKDPQGFKAAVLDHAALCEVDVSRGSMPSVDMARVLEIQADEMADDVEVRDGMRFWSEARLHGFFESGGVDPFAPPGYDQ